MATSRQKKNDTLAEVRELLKTTRNLVLTEYRGLNVEAMTTLRSDLRKQGVRLKVLKNTLLRRVMQETGYAETMQELIGGPVAVAFLGEDIAAGAKALTGFAKKNQFLVIRGGLLEGRRVAVDGVQALASLPSREVLLSMLLSAMQGPIKGFMTAAQGNTQKLMYALNAVKEQKEKAAA